MYLYNLQHSMQHYQYWVLVAFLDILSKYRDSYLGPFWISGSIAMFVLVLGNLYAVIFGFSVQEYMPHLAIGYVVWHMISSTVTQSLRAYTSNRAYILQSQLPLPVYNFKVILEIFIILLHNIILIGLVLVWAKKYPSAIEFGLFIIGSFAIIINMVWVSTLLALFGAAYRDVTEFSNVVMRVAFLATPVIWTLGSTGNREMLEGFMFWNPFYHFIEIVRAPLLSDAVNPGSWLIVGVLTIAGYALTTVVYNKYSQKVSTWI